MMKYLYSLRGRRIAALTVSLLTVLLVSGQDISSSEARKIAADFFKSHGVGAEAPAPLKIKQQGEDGGVNSPYYIFNNADAGAFVVVAGDSRMQPILAYSTDGAFDETDMAPGAAYMLEQYALYANSLDSGVEVPASRAAVDFGEGKLIQTARWNQSPSPWWDFCPIFDGMNTYAGCGATAMAIIMRHHQWPPKGFGNKVYTTKTLGLELTADFEAFDYDWAALPMGNMQSVEWTDESRAKIGKLLYQCGVAATMDYGTNESGSYGADQAVGLMRYFGYTMGSYLSKSDVSDDEWYGIIVDEINGGNLMMYRGETADGRGHAFICDGYNANGYLHFNFGWSGVNNGYYAILSSKMDYRFEQGVTVGIRPDYNAFTRELPDFHMRRNVNGNPTGLFIKDEGVIRRGHSFSVMANYLMNVSDVDAAFCIGVFICDGNGERKLQVGEYDNLALRRGNMYGWMTVRCDMPYEYTPDDDDCLALFSTTDGGETWKKVTCADPQRESLRLADVYDDTVEHLRLIAIDGLGLGLTESVQGTLNVKGQSFYVAANCLKNVLSQGFTGEVGAFLCDNEGNKKFMLGKSAINNLGSGYYYHAYKVGCTIPRGSDVQPGDRIILCSRMQGEEEWTDVNCVDPDKAYITVTEEMMHVTLPQMKLVAIEGRETGLALSEGSEITASGSEFEVTCYCLQNIMTETFEGEIAIFLCDKDGKPRLMVGIDEVSGLRANYYYYERVVKCAIPAETPLADGDRLCLFSRFHDDDVWVRVECVNPDLGYILLPDDTGVVSVENDKGEEIIYDLRGVRVDKPGRGIYIINGRKRIFR